MKHTHHSFRKALALLLCAVMAFGLLPISALAANTSAVIEDTDPSVTWNGQWGTWTESSDGSNTHFSNTAGATVTVPFEGTKIEVYGKAAWNGMIVEAVVDDGEAVDLDFYRNPGTDNKALIGGIADLNPGKHTLVLTVTNRFTQGSSASSEGKRQCEINFFKVYNEEPTPEPELNFANGAVHDTWSQDPRTVAGEGAICQVENNKLRLKSGSGNGNAHQVGSGGPAVFIDETASAVLGAMAPEDPKFYEFTIETLSTDNKGRFGLFLDYTDPGKSLFVGTEDGGWFWEVHPGDWYRGSRKPTLQPGTPVTVRVEWTGKTLTSATLDGVEMFPGLPLDFSSVPIDNNGRIAFRLATWGKPSEILLSDIHYSGQAFQPGYEITGKVVDQDGQPLKDAKISIDSKNVMSLEDGTFAFAGRKCLPDGTYTANVSKRGYLPTEAAVTVQGGAVVLPDITLQLLPTVSGVVRDAAGAPMARVLITVRDHPELRDVTDAEGAYTLVGVEAGSYTLVATADGCAPAELVVEVADADLIDQNINMTADGLQTAVLHTADMDVTVAMNFPRVIRYDMKGQLEGKSFFGQTREANQIQINSDWIVPTGVTAEQPSEDTINYVVPVQTKSGVNANIYITMKAEANTLTMTITDVQYPNNDRIQHPVESIYFYNHSLVSVRSSQAGANVITATLAANTFASGDRYYEVDDAMDIGTANNKGIRYAFLTTDGLSAGIVSNSDVGAGGAGADNERLAMTAEDRGSYKTVGVGANKWYYDRSIVSDETLLGAIANVTAEQKIVGIRPGIDEQPYVKIVITGDRNGDQALTWEDGAIAARDDGILHIPAHTESVPDLITNRIAMNFESEAPNPFLTTLDNAKRAYLHSDGLGQSILLKGYANEGHDSGHPDYFDIGRRMGGPEDMLTMLREGHKLGAQFGIHINCSEFYPEAKSFSEDAIYWLNTEKTQMYYGWNWLDQCVRMNGVYDLASGNRLERFQKLYDIVGNELDYIYVDVWGNSSSGHEDAWQTRKLSNEITNKFGWRIVHEWSFANDWDASFQHWVADFPYGDYTDKGKLNSNVIRFLLNSHKDSFPPDFPTYGGACNAPLLGGPSMQGFEGWQSDYEYDLFIDNLYNEMLPTKFLQHYDIMKWTNADAPVSLPYGAGAGEFSWSNTADWTPEVQIALQGKDGSNVVVTRGKDGVINDTYSYGSEAERLEYRSRNITLNGREILVGASNPGDFQVQNAVAGDLRYLIPWYWNTDGSRVTADNEKLYHYNIKGGDTRWQLPAGWETLANVTVYKLTDLGRAEMQTVAVDNGWVTLHAEPEIPYVVVKGEAGAPAPTVEWNAPGQHLTNVSFNATLETGWTAQGDAQIVKTGHDVPMLKLVGESSVKQQLDTLKSGTQYAVYVGVDNRSDANATLSVLDGSGKVVATNYTLRSFAPNAVGSYVHQTKHPTEAGESCFQNMYVFFTPKAGEVYTVVLAKEAGEGNTYFDDIRVLENPSQNLTLNAEGKMLTFKQDFEHNAQGLYPFVVRNGEQGAGAYNGWGTTDCRVHLSEKHAPYTQAGWQQKMVDDVLGGDWSLKINGQTGRRCVMYQTIPQNIHFDAGHTYTVSFDYQMGFEGAYKVVIGDGDQITHEVALQEGRGQTQTVQFTMTGADSGQSWFGIYTTDVRPIIPAGVHEDFSGYKDFILDNLVVTSDYTDAPAPEPTESITDAGRSLSLDGEIHINNYVEISNYDEEYIKKNGGMLVWNTPVTMEEAEVGSVGATNIVGLEKGTDLNRPNLYGQQTPGIAAKKYMDPMWMRVYVKNSDGSYTYGPLKKYSVREYCDLAIERAKAPDASMFEKDLDKVAIQLLHYGAAAQVYFDYNLDNPANKDIDPSAAWDAKLLETKPITNVVLPIQATGDVTKVGRSLSLDGEVMGNFYFKANGFEAASAELLVWDDPDGYDLTEEIAVPIPMIKTSDVFGAQACSFIPTRYSRPIYVMAKMTDGDGKVHYSDYLKFAPTMYAQDVMERGSDNLKTVVKQMLLYGQAAKDYLWA